MESGQDSVRKRNLSVSRGYVGHKDGDYISTRNIYPSIFLGVTHKKTLLLVHLLYVLLIFAFLLHVTGNQFDF